MAITGPTVFRFAGATLLGLSAAGIDHPRTLDDRTPHAPVAIANRDIPAGQLIDRMQVVIAQWPVGKIPAGAFTSIDSVAGRVTRVSVFKGEALVPGRLAPDGIGPGLEAKITPGKRAFTFRINDVSGIASLILPNSRVDMVLVVDDGEKRKISQVFMENMRVLAIAQARQRSEDGQPINAATCTVEVTADEGERVALATTQGQIQLMLRGYGDPDSAKTSGVDGPDLVARATRSRTRQVTRP